MHQVELKKIKIKAEKEIKEADSLKKLDEIFREYLGQKGILSNLTKSLSKLPKKKRASFGKEINAFKVELEMALEKKKKLLKERLEKEMMEKEWIDVTLPGKKIVPGHLHPLTQVQREVGEIFQQMGFSIVEGPEIETEWYNFDALNIPKDHPARDFWDTLYLKRPKSTLKLKILLRTHTSPVQVRFMEKNHPPLRIIVPGRVFRHEATDARHEINFHQVEGLMVDKRVSLANFRAIVEEFFLRFFNKKVKIRLRPSFFPFTEPSLEVDISCPSCDGKKKCSFCQNKGWLEVMGAGMVHPNVFKNSGLNPRDWRGFAFGMGLERLTMVKYKINDIRLFYSGDLRFLTQF